jgi:hypothetical protein
VAELKARGELEAVGGAAFVAGLFEEVTTSANLSAHAEMVLKAQRQRELIQASRDLAEAAPSADDPGALAAEFSERMREASQASTARGKLLAGITRSRALTPEDTPRPTSLLGGGLICGGDLAIMAGQPGLGKSRLALELGVAIAEGRPWMGLETGAEPACVLYLALEFSDYRWMQRCCHVFADELFTAEPEPEELHAVFNRLPLAAEGSAFHWVTRQRVEGGLDLTKRSGVAELAHATGALGARLVIADAMSRVMGDEDESPKVASAMLRHLDDFRYAAGCAVVFVHHERKVEDRSKTDALSMVRGSTKLTAGVNTIITVQRTPSRMRSVHFAKANYAREPEDIYYEIPEEGGPTVLLQSPEKAADKNVEKVWAFARGSSTGVTAEEAAQATGLSLRTCRRLLAKLEERGLERVKIGGAATGGMTWSWRVRG